MDLVKLMLHRRAECHETRAGNAVKREQDVWKNRCETQEELKLGGFVAVVILAEREGCGQHCVKQRDFLVSLW